MQLLQKGGAGGGEKIAVASGNPGNPDGNPWAKMNKNNVPDIRQETSAFWFKLFVQTKIKLRNKGGAGRGGEKKMGVPSGLPWR